MPKLLNEAIELHSAYYNSLHKFLRHQSSAKTLLATTIKEAMAKKKDGAWKAEPAFPTYQYIIENLKPKGQVQVREIDRYLNDLNRHEQEVEDYSRKLCDHLRKVELRREYFFEIDDFERNYYRINLRAGLALSQQGKLYLHDCMSFNDGKSTDQYTADNPPPILSISPLIKSMDILLQEIEQNKDEFIKYKKLSEENKKVQYAPGVQKILGEASNLTRESFDVVNDTLVLKRFKTIDSKSTERIIKQVTEKSSKMYFNLRYPGGTSVSPPKLGIVIEEVTHVRSISRKVETILKSPTYLKVPPFLGGNGKNIVHVNKICYLAASISLGLSFLNLAANANDERQWAEFAADVADKAEIIAKGLRFYHKAEIPLFNSSYLGGRGLAASMVSFNVVKMISVIGVLVGVSLSLYDAYNAWKHGHGPGAVFGHILTALGTLIFVFPSAGVIGLIALVLVVIGVIFVIIFTKSKLEEWFAHQWFGASWIKVSRGALFSETNEIGSMYYRWLTPNTEQNFVNQLNQFYTLIHPPFTVISASFDRIQSTGVDERKLNLRLRSARFKKEKKTIVIRLLHFGEPFIFSFDLQQEFNNQGVRYKDWRVGNISHRIDYKPGPGGTTTGPTDGKPKEIDKQELMIELLVPSQFWGRHNWEGFEIFLFPYRTVSSGPLHQVATLEKPMESLIGPVVRAEF